MRCEPNGYTNDYKIYLGKHDEMQGQSLGERVVKHLSKPLKWKGHMEIERKLAVGTIRTPLLFEKL